MIDQNTSTRWASKNVTLLNRWKSHWILRKETLDQMNFDLFRSKNNGNRAFEIQALWRNISNCVWRNKMEISTTKSAISTAEGGYHAYYFAEFPETTTESVKVILKAGFLGEPSLYEIAPLYTGVQADGCGDTSELEKWYVRQKPTELPTISKRAANIKTAFEEVFQTGKNNWKHRRILWFPYRILSDRYHRLGFGTTDKSN